jgi:hypothetical protein
MTRLGAPWPAEGDARACCLRMNDYVLKTYLAAIGKG